MRLHGLHISRESVERKKALETRIACPREIHDPNFDPREKAPLIGARELGVFPRPWATPG
jgi:hypothetical protein